MYILFNIVKAAKLWTVEDWRRSKIEIWYSAVLNLKVKGCRQKSSLHIYLTAFSSDGTWFVLNRYFADKHLAPSIWHLSSLRKLTKELVTKGLCVSSNYTQVKKKRFMENQLLHIGCMKNVGSLDRKETCVSKHSVSSYTQCRFSCLSRNCITFLVNIKIPGFFTTRCFFLTWEQHALWMRVGWLCLRPGSGDSAETLNMCWYRVF